MRYNRSSLSLLSPPYPFLVFIFSRSSLLRRIRRMYGKNNSCHPVTVEWFSKQILVNFEIFKLSIHPSLTHYGAQIYCFEKTTFFPKNQRLKWNLTSKHAAYKTSALIIWACRPLLETAPAARHPIVKWAQQTNKNSIFENLLGSLTFETSAIWKEVITYIL